MRTRSLIISLVEYDKINLKEFIEKKIESEPNVSGVDPLMLAKKIKDTKWLSLNVERSLNEDIILYSSHVVGIKKYSVGDSEVIIIVKPKIPNGNFLAMLNYAFELNLELTKKDLEIWNDENDFQLIFIYFYLQKLNKFLKKHFSRNFVQKSEVFNSKVRGKINTISYINNFYGKLKPQFIPCSYYTLTEDILENQLLNLSITAINKLLKRINSELKYQCIDLLRKCEFYFHGVSSLNYYSPSMFKKIKYVGKIRPYKEIHSLAKFILESFYLSLNENINKTQFVEFQFDMNILFEKFVSGIISEFTGTYNFEYSKKYEFDISENSSIVTKSNVIPDIIVNNEYVFDAKYKIIKENDIRNNGVSITDKDLVSIPGRLLVKHSDIHQMNSYLDIESSCFKKGFLVYPTDIKSSFEVNGFNNKIEFMGIDISKSNILEEVRRFHKNLELKIPNK